MGLHRERSIKVFEAIFALTEIGQIHGVSPIRLHVQTQMLHELDVVHVHLLAQVAFECHVGFKLTGQYLLKKREKKARVQFISPYVHDDRLFHKINGNVYIFFTS